MTLKSRPGRLYFPLCGAIGYHWASYCPFGARGGAECEASGPLSSSTVSQRVVRASRPQPLPPIALLPLTPSPRERPRSHGRGLG